MVSQRQRLARKRYKEEHPELFPKTEPTPPKDPDKKKKKKNKRNALFKRKKEKEPGIKGSSGRRHPLRVPGMRPGESCFICKAKDHIAKSCPEKAEWEKNKVFFFVCAYSLVSINDQSLSVGHCNLTSFGHLNNQKQ